MNDYIINIKQRLVDYFSARPEIKFAYIFGSTAKGMTTCLSDIDIAIFVDFNIMKRHYPYGYKASVLTDLLKLLQTNDVDMVILNSASCLLKHRVIRDGIVIYSCSEKDRINFQVRTIDEYIDLKHLLEIHNKTQGAA